MRNGDYTHRAEAIFLKKSEHFFSLCIDGFFDKPDIIRNFGLSLPKYPDSHGVIPGKHSLPLHEIDDTLNTNIILKILESYYDLDDELIHWAASQVKFHEVPKYDEDKNNIKNKGWIHQDYFHRPSFVAIIYLTPEADPDTGTSIFEIKENRTDPEIQEEIASGYVQGNSLYKNEEIDEKLYEKNFEKWEDNFIETIKYQNIYNRLITYAPEEYHKANNYHNKGENRLTLICDIAGIEVDKYPLHRVKKIRYDNIIEKQISQI